MANNDGMHPRVLTLFCELNTICSSDVTTIIGQGEDMNDEHDPLSQISLLQQCLSQNKKPLGLFLGAGCPLSIKIKVDQQETPLIPGIDGITKVVRDKLTQSNSYAESFKQLEEHFAKDGNENPNVEDILSHIRGLRTVVGKDTIRGLTADNLDALDAEICAIIHELVNKELPTETTAYHKVAAWVEATTRVMPVEIFTTNYDLLMEQALEALRVPYFDGFAGACKPSFDLRAIEEDQLSSRWARLWKLHGSINWYQNETKGVFRAGKDEQSSKRVIHPSHLKYDESRRMPYLAMLDRLRAFLRQPSAAFILCGYSFRDDHINEVIIQGLGSRFDHLSADGRGPAFVPHVNFHFPGEKYTVMLVVEPFFQERNNGIATELSFVF